MDLGNSDLQSLKILRENIVLYCYGPCGANIYVVIVAVANENHIQHAQNINNYSFYGYCTH